MLELLIGLRRIRRLSTELLDRVLRTTPSPSSSGAMRELVGCRLERDPVEEQDDRCNLAVLDAQPLDDWHGACGSVRDEVVDHNDPGNSSTGTVRSPRVPVRWAGRDGNANGSNPLLPLASSTGMRRPHGVRA